MIPELSKHHEAVRSALNRIVATYGAGWEAVNEWGVDLRSRIVEFAGRGKLIRGALVAAGCEAFGGRTDESVYEAAAVVELVQSFLLIHDDIMDEDRVRRGAPAVVEQYRQAGLDRSYMRVDRYAESMGICAGDVALLVAIQALSGLSVGAETAARLVGLVAGEIALVGVAQMGDVANGHSRREIPDQEIITLYRYKTGRYTFSLPLMMGAALAGAGAATIDRIAAWGELQGVVFQIRDDLLDVTEDSDRTGKPTGSDVVANKQTLWRRMLLERLDAAERGRLVGLFGKDDLAESELAELREALVSTGTQDELERRISEFRREAARIVEGISGITSDGMKMLTALDRYNSERSR